VRENCVRANRGLGSALSGNYAAAVNAPKLDAPIVLAHGMLGLLQGLVSSARIENYFRGIPAWLRAAGNEVLVTHVPGIGAVTRRAEILKESICAALDRPVHIVAHSQGGLDARHMICHLGMADRVLSLTTIGTPHRGSPIADWGVAAADATGIFQIVEQTTIDTQGFLDLRSGEAAAFNERTPDVAGVRYFSIGGECPRDLMLPTLRLCHDYIAKHEGPNDGLVSLKSSAWGEDCVVWAGDHAHQIGWFAGDHFDWKPHWAALLERVR
jgi:triacylglycerol lipase